MSRKKRPETPQPRFSASRNAAQVSPEQFEAEPRHRLRDEKSNVSPLDALRKAKELSEKVSERQKTASDELKGDNSSQATNLPQKPVSKPPVAPVVRRSEPPALSHESEPQTGETPTAAEEETAEEPTLAPEHASAPVDAPHPSTGDVSFNLGQMLANATAEEETAVEESRVSEETEEPASAPVEVALPAEPVQKEPEPEFIDYVASPFQQRKKADEESSSIINADKVFDTFLKSTESDNYQPVNSVDDEDVEPLLLGGTGTVEESTVEDDLLEFRRLTPEIEADEPDFNVVRKSLLESNERRAARTKQRIRRVVFEDIKRRGSGLLPKKSFTEAAVIDSMFFPERKLSAERYLKLYAMQSPFKVDKNSGPSYKRRISQSLKQAILEDRSHPSEYNQPESYDIDAPLPELLPSDFVEEGLPQVFVEGGMSVEEALKAKRAERRDKEGNIKRDLPSADFVEEAFSEFFIDYAEKHNKTYEQLTAPVSYDISADLDDELLDWAPVFPPAVPEGSLPVETAEERSVPAGAIVEDREYDLELSHEDYVDEEGESLPEPVRVASIESSTYREDYMDSLDPDLFLSDFFGEDETSYVGEVEELNNDIPAAEAVAGVPVKAEGEATINKGWMKYNLGLAGSTVGLIVAVVLALTLFRGESAVITGLIGAAGVAVGAFIAAMKVMSYRKVSIDFGSQTVKQGRRQFTFDEISWGEGSSYSKGTASAPKVLKLGSDETSFVKILLEKGTFKLPQTEAEAIIDLLNQTVIPYSSETDLEDIHQKRFVGTKRNLSMLTNSSFMG